MREALDRAEKLKLDLVEVQRTANPPVCKIMDFNREKYKQQTKEKERSKSKGELTLRQGDVKNIRFTPKTDQKDLEMKANTVKRLMEKGYRVKCMAMGNEDQDLGALLSHLFTLIEDVSVIESGPKEEKKQAYMIVRHTKFGPTKKGGTKSTVDIAEPKTAKNSSKPIQSPLKVKAHNMVNSDLESDVQTETQTPLALNRVKPTLLARDASNGLEEGKIFPSSSTDAGLLHPKQPSTSQASSPQRENRYGRKNEQQSRVPPTKLPERMHNDTIPLTDQRSRFPPTNLTDRTPRPFSEQRSRFPPTNLHVRTPRLFSEQRSRFPPTNLTEGTPNNVKPLTDIKYTPSATNSKNVVHNQRREQQKIVNTQSSTETKRIVMDGAQQSRPDISNLPPPSYGIFSVIPSENKVKERNSLDPKQNRTSSSVILNPDKQNPGGSKQGGWGVFSRPQ
ncbi:hypothetical protein GIB67_007982 [Kingdonia uniflora]|uniref:Translation initiation factor 3 n=1 Tax=Kingdonia uniflora TaxID=39325 RepID=A0A7J7L9C3_9MAGN|nr:hypothetical protein GIB67_007982 [Kingdonia uniflora]